MAKKSFSPHIIPKTKGLKESICAMVTHNTITHFGMTTGYLFLVSLSKVGSQSFLEL